jgi:aldehyde dehydrogenase (NAD+)
VPIADLLPLEMALTEAKIETDLINEAFERQRKAAIVLRKEALAGRIDRLQKLRTWIHANRAAIHQAMFDDFSKPAVEVDSIEIFHVLNEIKHAISHIHEWARPKKIDAPITMLGTRSYIQYEPRGVCLIISPWNYPFSLAVGPLISAIAAGNTVIIKPSEVTPNVSAILRRMCAEIFKPEIVTVIEGDAEVSSSLLKLPFDHIFFTGSPAIGKIVMKAAAENLTSVTLELGGKSPAIVTRSANLRDAAQRIAVAKFINNGQTCIAPDYVLVDENIAAEFVRKTIEQTKKLFSENNDFQKSRSYCRIVNQKHFKRVNDLIQQAINAGAKVEFGGNSDEQTRFIHPMILSRVPPYARMMEDEIFGPVLPILTFRNIDEAISVINSKPKPLALYVYSTTRSEKKKVLTETTAGAVCINDSGIHFLHHHLPFGGVNNSGIGKSHGYYGFLAFSNEKPVLQQKSGFTSVRLFYPPYTAISKKIMDWFLKLF